jgi:ribonuclease HI
LRKRKLISKQQKRAEGPIERKDNSHAMIHCYTDGGARNLGGGKLDQARVGVWFPSLNRKYAFNVGLGTSNQAEYEAIIAALHIALTLGYDELELRSDSELCIKHIEYKVFGKVDTGYECRKDTLTPLLRVVTDLAKQYTWFRIIHVPRTENREADALTHLAATRKEIVKPSKWSIEDTHWYTDSDEKE